MKKEFKEGNITITVDYDKCKGSGECVTACPVEIFELVDGKAVAKKNRGMHRMLRVR
jgi:Fe-S-cluster-containing hydrogenase component 2